LEERVTHYNSDTVPYTHTQKHTHTCFVNRNYFVLVDDDGKTVVGYGDATVTGWHLTGTFRQLFSFHKQVQEKDAEVQTKLAEF